MKSIINKTKRQLKENRHKAVFSQYRDAFLAHTLSDTRKVPYSVQGAPSKTVRGCMAR